MRTILSALLMLISTSPFAQIAALDYYRITNEAELAICRKDLPAAAALYRKAFTINPNKPFTKDLLNAFYCAMDRNDFPEAKRHLAQVLGRGINSEGLVFLKTQFKAPARDSIGYWLGTLRNDTLKSSPMLTSIKRMQHEDLAMREHFGGFRTGNYMVDSVYDMDERNGNILAGLFRQYGVPNEDAGSVDYELNGGPAFFLLAHHHGGAWTANPKRESHALDTLLFKAIFTHDYHPQRFAQFLQHSEFGESKQSFRYGNYQLSPPIAVPYIFVWEDSSIHPQYYTPEVEAKGNAQRRSIGLESFSELRRKLLFHKIEELAGSGFEKYALTDGISVVFDAEDLAQADKYIKEFELYKPK